MESRNTIMTLEKFMNEAISPWMREQGPEDDIVLSTRVRLARNIEKEKFPIIAEEKNLDAFSLSMKNKYNTRSFNEYKNLEYIQMSELSYVEKKVLVEKHLISPYLIKSHSTAALISENEKVSVMINEEDHIRIQVYFPGFQVKEALDAAFKFDDWLEKELDYAFDEEKGYLTSCPTNTGTGMRASVMIHLPGLVLTKRIKRMLPAINQLGFVVRGIYGEGTEATGNVFQISNQITLGKSEADIIEDLRMIVIQLIEQERAARVDMLKRSRLRLEDRIYRSFGILKYSRIIESKEASTKISDLKLGVDLGVINGLSHSILNELIILTQPGFLQHYADKILTLEERDELRAELIRKRLKIK